MEHDLDPAAAAAALTRCGGSAACAAAFRAALAAGDKAEAERLLFAQRQRQPGRLHREQEKLDCLDLLRWKLRQAPGGNGGDTVW